MLIIDILYLLSYENLFLSQNNLSSFLSDFLYVKGLVFVKGKQNLVLTWRLRRYLLSQLARAEAAVVAPDGSCSSEVMYALPMGLPKQTHRVQTQRDTKSWTQVSSTFAGVHINTNSTQTNASNRNGPTLFLLRANH